MNSKPILFISASVISMISTGHADVLYSNAGPLVQAGTVSTPGTSLVNTTNDTADWITTGGYNTGTSTTPLYMQVTMNVTDNNDETAVSPGFYTALELFKGSTYNIGFGNNSTSLNWGGFFAGTTAAAGDFDLTGSPAYALNTPASFVIKLDQQANRATVYFNPNLSLTEAAQPSGSITVRSSLGSFDEFDSLNIRTGFAGTSTTFSNIVVRNDSPFSPVPEPGTTLLAGVAGLWLIRRRR